MADDVSDDAVDDEVDSVDLIFPNRAKFTISGTRYTLRAPRNGEYKRLRLGLVFVQEKDLTTAEQTVRSENWVRETFDLLSDPPFTVETDEWPPWLASPLFLSRLFIHWYGIPDVEDGTVEVGEDTLERLPSGKTRFNLDGVVYKMRLPKHGEYKRFQLLFDESREQSVEDQMALVDTWVRDAFKTLADRSLPDDENEWPGWLTSGIMSGRLLVHWRDIPLAPGAPLAK